MNSDRWEAVAQIFTAALDKPLSERQNFVLQESKGDCEIEREVLKLLAADEKAGSFLEKPLLMALTAQPAVSTPSLLSPGHIVSGRFEIVRFIGQGGMGQVYEALDLELKVRVALKAIRPEIAADVQALSRFKREVLLTRRITHPNVCRTFDIDRHTSASDGKIDTDITFLTMELLQGETLAELLRCQVRLTPPVALPLVLQIIDALSAAHHAGIIHRDLKPSNVLLVPSPSGVRVVVTDFGLARAVVSDAQLSVDSVASTHTGAGGLMGTLVYMAPEQFERGEATVATDIYALGLVMYEMLTGQRPFADAIPFAEAAKRIKQPAPSPKILVTELERAWEEATLGCLEREPERRFQTAGEVADSLLGSETTVAAKSGPRSFAQLLPNDPRRPWGRQKPQSIVIACSFLLAVSLLGLLLRYYIRQQAPIQFAERDWILVTDFNNKTGEAVFDRVVRDLVVQSLSQSAYVNVVPRLSALEAAQRAGITTVGSIDQKLGRELCLRENYKALLTGEISREGSRYAVAMILEVSGKKSSSIYETENIQSPEEIYSAVDRMATRLRQALGEPLSKIESSTKMLAQVTTPSLDALQRYSAALDLYGAREYERCINLANDAIERDPNFAMAHLLLARAYEQMGNDAIAETEFERARLNSGHSSERERHIILAAKYASYQQNEKAAQEYQHLLDIYPDDLQSLRNFAIAAYYAGQPERGITAQRRALALSPNDPGCYDYLMELLIRTNQFTDALTIFEQARSHNVETVGFRFLAALAAWGNGDLQKAQQLLNIPANEGSGYTDLVSKLYIGKLFAYQGRMREAIESFDAGLALARRRPGLEEWTSVFHYQLAKAELVQGKPNDAALNAQRYAELVKPLSNTGSFERAGSLAVNLRDLRSAQEFTELIKRQAKAHDDSFSEMELHTLEGEIALARGQRRKAVLEERKANYLLMSYEPLMALGEACEEERDWNCSIQAYTKYLEQKGAVLRHDVASDWVVANYQLARVYVAAGDRKKGIAYCQRFLDLFVSADSQLPVVVRATRDLRRWKASPN